MQIFIEYTDKGINVTCSEGPPELVIAVLEMAKHIKIAKMMGPQVPKSEIVVPKMGLVK